MFNRTRIAGVLTAICCAASLCLPVLAADVDCDSVYCFTGADFQEEVVGICVTDLPDPGAGTVMLGTRVVRPGDILTAEQLSMLTFSPLWTEEDRDAVVTYLPIFENRVAQEATMTIAIHGKQDKAPIAEDSAMETYKNLENTGRLKVTDPEGQKLTFTVTRQPKRGTLELKEDGTYLYTPKKNKVGVDSFTYTATDPAGNVSREATVTIQIIKPADAAMYTDTAGTDCQFTAQWLKNTGIFAGEQVGGDCCFSPERAVTRGEFLAMTMKALGLEGDPQAEATGFEDESPAWLKPYLAAAQRSGLVRGYATETGAEFRADQPITGAEAAAMLSSALDLPSAVISEDRELPVWAATALATVSDNGFALTNTETVTRAEAANALYTAVQLANEQNRMK